MKKKTKNEKPLKVDMEFDEMMQRISRVDKSQIESNIKRNKNNKKQ